MPDFTMMPEAVDYVAGQAWLTPHEAGGTFDALVQRRPSPPADRLSWASAVRDIQAILSRVG